MKKYQPIKPIRITATAITVIITGLLTSWLPTAITSLSIAAAPPVRSSFFGRPGRPRPHEASQTGAFEIAFTMEVISTSSQLPRVGLRIWAAAK
jgi:hypothetical protein